MLLNYINKTNILSCFAYRELFVLWNKRIIFILVWIALMCYSTFYLSSLDLLFALLIAPVVTYSNADQDKALAVRHNRGKSGIYRWVHIESGKSYIGSSVNLSIRLSQYYNYNHISDPKHNMTIYKALLRYGYATFRLEILEFCTLEKLMEREQFYIDNYKPEYNILKVAGSSFGFRHSEASKELMSLLAKGRLFSTETLLKMKERTVSEEVKLKISAALKGRKVTQ